MRGAEELARRREQTLGLGADAVIITASTQSNEPIDLAARAVRKKGRIVLVGVASTHRGAAFAAAEFLMDYLKTRAPFWKLEERENGATWVEARESDDHSAERWRR